MSELWKDLRFGIRLLLRSPGFSIIGILSLGLGIGLITAVFSLIGAFFLRPLPFEKPDRLVHVWQVDKKIDLDQARMSVPNFEDLRAQSGAFVDLGGYFYTTCVLGGSSDGDTTATINATAVTPNVFQVLGVEPMIGRPLAAEDGLPGAGKVVVLSHDFWRRRMDSRAHVVGESVVLDDLTYTVVGVMPQSFVFPFNKMDVWMPLALEPYREQRATNGPLLVIGRLAVGETLTTAQAELDTLMKRLESEHPESNRGLGANIVDLRSQLLFTYDIFRVVFPTLLLAIGFVILIVCANLGNLILARAADRSQEMAFRLTLGASRSRLVRQLLTENVLLAVLGGAIGVVFASTLTRGLERNLPGELYRVGAVEVDATGFLFAALVSLGSAVLFGLAPALQSTSFDLARAVKEGGRGAIGTLRRRRLRNTLVVVQIALAVLLVTGSGLMVKTFMTLQSVDLGFEADHMLTFEVKLSNARYPGDSAENGYFDRVIERIGALPGVESVAAIYPLPLNHESLGSAFEVAGRDTSADEQLFANTMWVTPGWFETARIPLVAGRRFEGLDSAEAVPVVMVNRRLAERIWPAEDAVGKRIVIRDQLREVVGVVENSVYLDIDEETPMLVYYPQHQISTARRFLMVRTQGPPNSSWPSVEAATSAVDPAQPLETVRSMNEVIALWYGPWMMGIGGLSLLGVGALFLAAMGLYGTVGYSVSRRRHEFGIRNALGAQGRDILRLVLRQGVALVAIGLVAGLCGAALLTRFLQTLLFGVEALDPLTFLATPLILLAVSLVACWLPARRAMRVDPSVALREV